MNSWRIAGGSSLPYDRLLIATGVTPNRPPIPGIDLPNVLACWTLDDARNQRLTGGGAECPPEFHRHEHTSVRTEPQEGSQRARPW